MAALVKALGRPACCRWSFPRCVHGHAVGAFGRGVVWCVDKLLTLRESGSDGTIVVVMVW